MGFELRQEVIKYSCAQGAAYHVHLTLAIRARDSERRVRMSVAQLISETRLREAAIRGGFKTLCDLKHISRNRRGSKKGINCFILHPLHPPPDGGSPSTTLHQMEIVGQQPLPGGPIRKGYRKEDIDVPASPSSPETAGAVPDSLHSADPSPTFPEKRSPTSPTQDNRGARYPKKEKTTPPPPPSRRRGRRELLALPGFPPQTVIDLWNATAVSGSGLTPFTEIVNDRIRHKILKRQHEQPERSWWEVKFSEVSKNDWLRGIGDSTFHASLMWLLDEKGWDKLSTGQFAPAPKVRKLQL